MNPPKVTDEAHINFLKASISWFEAKTAIVRPTVRAYLANPLYTLPATA